MADRIVTLEIDVQKGSMTVETSGFQGKGCKAIHEAFEVMGKTTQEVIKPEYNEGNQAQNTLSVRH